MSNSTPFGWNAKCSPSQVTHLPPTFCQLISAVGQQNKQCCTLKKKIEIKLALWTSSSELLLALDVLVYFCFDLVGRQLSWGLFLEGHEKFSHPESHSKISKLIITELFYLHNYS